MARALDLDEPEADAVAAGGLLHDLGHPPLSHTLDGPMREVLGCSHERRSRALVTGELERLGGPAVPPSRIPRILEKADLDPRRIAALIDPADGRERAPLLRQLLHGAIDADRIDYLQRDAHYTGVAHGAIDATRLLETIFARRGRLVFAEKGRHAVEGFLVGRSLMYSTVYYHKTVRAAEVMAEAAVTRMRGFPESAGPLLDGTDGDLFVALESAGGRSAELARALRERRLFRRLVAVRRLDPAARRTMERLARDPAARREAEEELAEGARAPAGSLLLDLAGLEGRRTRSGDWQDVAILEGGVVTHPFEREEPWRSMAGRPRAPWELSIYAERRHEAALRRSLRRSGLLDA